MGEEESSRCHTSEIARKVHSDALVAPTKPEWPAESKKWVRPIGREKLIRYFVLHLLAYVLSLAIYLYVIYSGREGPSYKVGFSVVFVVGSVATVLFLWRWLVVRLGSQGNRLSDILVRDPFKFTIVLNRTRRTEIKYLLWQTLLHDCLQFVFLMIRILANVSIDGMMMTMNRVDQIALIVHVGSITHKLSYIKDFMKAKKRMDFVMEPILNQAETHMSSVLKYFTGIGKEETVKVICMRNLLIDQLKGRPAHRCDDIYLLQILREARGNLIDACNAARSILESDRREHDQATIILMQKYFDVRTMSLDFSSAQDQELPKELSEYLLLKHNFLMHDAKELGPPLMVGSRRKISTSLPQVQLRSYHLIFDEFDRVNLIRLHGLCKKMPDLSPFLVSRVLQKHELDIDASESELKVIKRWREDHRMELEFKLPDDIFTFSEDAISLTQLPTCPISLLDALDRHLVEQSIQKCTKITQTTLCCHIPSTDQSTYFSNLATMLQLSHSYFTTRFPEMVIICNGSSGVDFDINHHIKQHIHPLIGPDESIFPVQYIDVKQTK